MLTVFPRGASFYALLSSAPAVYGEGKSKKEAINALSENIYKFCNWLSVPYPAPEEWKECNLKILPAQGRILAPWEKEPDKRTVRLYRSVALQAAFSFKCLADSLPDEEAKAIAEETVFRLNALLRPYGKEGLIGGVAELTDLPADGELAGTLREISLLLFSSAERISALCMENHIPFSDAFRFRYSLAETDRA